MNIYINIYPNMDKNHLRILWKNIEHVISMKKQLKILLKNSLHNFLTIYKKLKSNKLLEATWEHERDDLLKTEI